MLVRLDIVSIQVVIVDTSSIQIHLRFRNAVICASLRLENGSSLMRQVVRTAILVRDVPYGTLQLVFFEFFKELPPFFRKDQIPLYRNGRLELKACDFGGSVLRVDCICRSIYFHMTSAKFVCESQNSGDILVHQDFLYFLQQGFDFEMCWFHLISTIGTDGAEWWGVYASVPGALGFFGAWFIEACAIIRMKTCTHLRTHQ